MKFNLNWKHVSAVLTGVFLPAVIAALQGQPITRSTVLTALGSGAMVAVAAMIKSPIVDPGVQQ